MDINKEYFNDKSEAEKLRNVSSLVNSIVNAEPEKTLKVEAGVGEGDGVEELPEVDPLVDLVGKAISKGRPKGFFMQGVQTDDNTKL
ncbi:uncharacterized protein METZ01_LOCUS306275 [marine metagenome]|jgi:hypothetical protein|uniref:Uncharacterized protein n=1 Tax=marine metagenome TaxID=408172 RepID=A0A382N1M3_9ZZZZ